MPAWALPPPEERALVDQLTKQCRDYDAAVAAVSAGRFLDANAAHRRAETVVEARRVTTLKSKASDDTPAGCFDVSVRLFNSIWFEMGVRLEEGLRAKSDHDRFEAYFEVASSQTSLSDEAKRRIGTAGLDHWLAQARTNCDDFYGASEQCVRPLRLIDTIAPGSTQAKTAAAIVAEARRLDSEMLPLVRAANVLLKARGKLCAQLNHRDCQWSHKNPSPVGRDKLAKYGHKLPSDDQTPGWRDKLNGPPCDLDDESQGCADRGQMLPTRLCPSYWDTSPATLQLEEQWRALLVQVPSVTAHVGAVRQIADRRRSERGLPPPLSIPVARGEHAGLVITPHQLATYDVLKVEKES